MTCEMTVTTNAGQEVDATIEYTVLGGYRPATRIDPEEHAEVEIGSIIGVTEEGETFEFDETNFAENEWKRIQQAVEEDHNNAQYDPAWDGPEEDDR